MLNIINGKNYLFSGRLWWGSDEKDVSAPLNSALNSVDLMPESITSLEVITSLAYPFFRGSFEYIDKRQSSIFRNMVDMPSVYGSIVFCIVNGSDVPGSDNIVEPMEGETFSEEIFVTGINTIDDGQSDFVKVKVSFVSSDYLKFISNMAGISTYDGFDTDKKPMKDIIVEMFAAVGLSDKLDVDSLNINVDIPYVSTENDTLLTALDYVYRKIFDADFSERNGKTYCRIVYDLTTHKYTLWRFDGVGTKDALDTKLENLEIKNMRENVEVNSLVGPNSVAVYGKVAIKTSGNQSLMFENIDNLRFVDYDYLGNTFETSIYEKNGDLFIDHDDEFNYNLKSRMQLLEGNARKFKENKYERTFTTSRQNGSFYDVFTDVIFKTSFLRVEAPGSIGRRAGNQLMLSFNNSTMTIYEQMGGDYLVTATRFLYESKNGGNTFISTMDLYRPYYVKDSEKSGFIP